MTCNDYQSAVEAWIDGQCPADEAAELERHLQFCATCRSYADELETQRTQLRWALGGETAPPDLWPRIAARLGFPRVVPQPARRDPHRLGTRQLLAAAAIITIVALGALTLVPALPTDPGASRGDTPVHTVVDATVQDFVTFRLSERAYDIASSDPNETLAWFATRVSFELPPLEAHVLGYRLVGGRLCWLLDQRIGAFTYERDEQHITLYVMQADAMDMASASIDSVLAKAGRGEQDGYRSLVWRQQGLIFSLVSEVSDEEMTRFSDALIAAVNQSDAKQPEKSI
jgi:anti-sigma factor RsiW